MGVTIRNGNKISDAIIVKESEPIDETIYIDTVPSSFTTATTFYVCKVTDDRYLLSSNVSSTGVYLYKKNLNTLTRIINSDSWNGFQPINGKCLISRGSSYLIYLYNSADDSCVSLNIYGGGYNAIYAYDNYCLFNGSTSSYSGIVLFDSLTNEITNIYAINGQWDNFYRKDNNILIGSSSNNGVLVFNIDTQTVELGYSSGYWNVFCEFEDKIFMSHASTDTGILLWDITNNVFKRIYNDGRNWCNFKKINNYWVISSYGVGLNASMGVLIYDETSEDLAVKKYTGGRYWCYFQEVNSGCLITSGSSAGSDDNGVLLFDLNDKTITRKYTLKYDYNIFTKDGDNYYIESSNLSHSQNVLYYNDTDKTVTLSKMKFKV